MYFYMSIKLLYSDEHLLCLQEMNAHLDFYFCIFYLMARLHKTRYIDFHRIKTEDRTRLKEVPIK